MVILNVVLKLYNTLTRKKELFTTLKDGEVKMYACGPTVYDYPHIGNYRAYVFEDLLRRYLEYSGYKVKLVMNITDVDDKTIAASGGNLEELKAFTKKYEGDFKAGLDTLKIKEADEYPRATETIDEMVELINRLIEKEFAYKSDDGSIYFSIDKYPDYGKLVHLNPEDMRSGERVQDDEYEKGGARDFVLWKAWKESDGDIHWDEGLGKGRPGWHIECSAMSMTHLGEQIDIHCGGVDNIFPHHENEIAQSEAATGNKFVRFWVHCAHLILDGEKMSKSLGNIRLLDGLIKEGHSPEAIRLALLSTHYRTQLDLTNDLLEDSGGKIKRIKSFLASMKRVKGGSSNININKKLADYTSMFEKAFDDDLYITGALNAVFGMIGEMNRLRDNGKLDKQSALEIINTFEKFDQVLKLNPMEQIEINDNIIISDEIMVSIETRGGTAPQDIVEIAKQRVVARSEKKWEEADRLREEMESAGWQIEDVENGFVLKKKD